MTRKTLIDISTLCPFIRGTMYTYKKSLKIALKWYVYLFPFFPFHSDAFVCCFHYINSWHVQVVYPTRKKNICSNSDNQIKREFWYLGHVVFGFFFFLCMTEEKETIPDSKESIMSGARSTSLY